MQLSLLLPFLYLPLCFSCGDLGDGVNYYLTNPNANNLKYDPNNPSKWLSAMRPDCTTVFLVHGFLPVLYIFENQTLTTTAVVYQQVTNECYNVVRVYWELSNYPDYFADAENVVTTGNQIAAFIDCLYKQGRLTGSRVDCTGHSLGAHICGNTGRRLQQLGVQGFEVVTGLDPAGPSFTQLLCVQNLGAYKLASGDGRLVVTVMTNGGVFGSPVPLGDVNFIANGGKQQPGCLILDPGCSHGRAIGFNQEAILHPYFIGRTSNGKSAVFGRSMPLDVAHGTYYFSTNSGSPYGPSS